MERYTPQERGIIVSMFLTNNRSVVLAQREFRRRFPNRGAPTGQTFRRLATRLEQSGTTEDLAGRGRHRTGRTAENIAAVAADVAENKETSTRRRATRLGITRRTLQRILVEDLHMFPCIVQTRSADQEWEEYKTKFNKSYKDDEEDKMRRKLFFDNKAKIDEHNKRQEAGEVNWSMTVNAFADNTPEEHAVRCGRGAKQ